MPDNQPTAEHPVAASMRIAALANGNHAVVITVEIFPGWHAYDALPDGSPYTAMVPTLTLPKGVTQVDAWRRPSSQVYVADPSVTVFEGKFEFACAVAGSQAAVRKLTCQLGYQVCDANMCQPPTVLDLTVSDLPVSDLPVLDPAVK